MKTTDPTTTRWPADRLLKEARRRTADLMTDNTKRVQEMLSVLVAEAGWTDSEFVDALCSDVIVRAENKARPRARRA